MTICSPSKPAPKRQTPDSGFLFSFLFEPTATHTETTGMTTDTIEASNWRGAVPVILSLAPTSLSSPTIPPPLHKMVSRQSYLHTALEKEVKRLYKFAPMMLSLPSSVVRTEPGLVDEGESTPTDSENRDGMKKTGETKGGTENDELLAARANAKRETQAQDKYPVCWFEDEETGLPLRWHLFAGILFDSKQAGKEARQSTEGEADRSIAVANDAGGVPWRIRLHFNNYPSSQILPLDQNDNVLTVVQRMYKNSLKQALFLQSGSSKVAMNLSKQSHQQVWDSIVSAKHQLYREVNKDLRAAPSSIPIRVLLDSKPAIQKHCDTKGACRFLPPFFGSSRLLLSCVL